MKLKILPALILPLLAVACVDNPACLQVANNTDFYLGTRVVSFPFDSLSPILGTPHFYITGPDGNEVPSQLTADSQVLFVADVAPGQTSNYIVHPCDTVRRYNTLVYGQEYPRRRDDIASENRNVGFRIYGPGTQQAGETAYGYDIFFKHISDSIILPLLYAPETDPEVWARVDSLRAISPELAQKYIDTFSYHIDHGLGMDCYAVGPTLGDGTAALLLEGNRILFPWCYEKAEIVDNGPLRFTLKLKFAPVQLSQHTTLTEHRVISLDAYARLNDCRVWYDGNDSTRTIAAGFPLRDDTRPFVDPHAGIIAYADPTQGPNNGRALLGIVTSLPLDSATTLHDHVLGVATLQPHKPFVYSWGFAWDRTDISTLEQWVDYLKLQKQTYTVSLQ